MKRSMVLFVFANLLLLAGTIVFLAGEENSPRPVVLSHAEVAGNHPVPAPAVQPEPERWVVLGTVPLPTAEPQWRPVADDGRAVAAPMPFGQSMFGPWDTGKVEEP